MLSAPRRAWTLHGNNGARRMGSQSRRDSRPQATSAARSKSPEGAPGIAPAAFASRQTRLGDLTGTRVSFPASLPEQLAAGPAAVRGPTAGQRVTLRGTFI